jgi:phenylpropionate dioxygenase-like ring-hydroxylating dioxygenase large terminal subunit
MIRSFAICGGRIIGILILELSMNSVQASLDPRHYHDAEIFSREQADIFSRSWIFAGLADDLSRPDDYFLAKVGSQEVIVRKGRAGLRAFGNVCSHRHSRIHDQPKGNARLVCPYHGWAYDDDGLPVGIPQSENFAQVCADRQSFALQQPELETVGKFVFVRLQPGGPGLPEFLGDAWAFLNNISPGIGVCLDEFHGGFDANWKIVVENAVESYHVPIVHPGTFVSSSQFSTSDEDVSDQQFDVAGHSQRVAMADPDWLRRWKAFATPLGRWPFEFDRYTHQFVFPSFTLTSFMGYGLHLQSFFPGGVGVTTLHSRIYSVNCEGFSEDGAGVMQTIHEEAVKFAHKVINEDRRACALVHEGSRFASRKALLGTDVEKRVRHFQNAYLQALNGVQGHR